MKIICNICNGYGTLGLPPQICHYCEGTGIITIDSEYITDKEVCLEDDD